MKLGWIYDRRFLQHDTGDMHLERRERLEAITRQVEESGIRRHLIDLPLRQALPTELALVHDPAYVDLVRMMCDEGFQFIGAPDTCVCPLSYDVAALAAGGVLAACGAVVNGVVPRAFCAVRPPGHHAEMDQALGFCLFNNVALGAAHLVQNFGLTRVAIVDIDVHHGNGTQHTFEARRDVLYISLHERPGSLEFPGSGEAQERGRGPGVGYTLNVPLDRGTNSRQYLLALQDHVIPALHDFRPEFLLISAGFDALMWDNVANLSLEPAAFGPVTAALVEIAERYSSGRVVSVLEGGYDLGNLGQAVVTHLWALAGESS